MMQCFSGFFSRVAHHRVSVTKISGEKPDILNSAYRFGEAHRLFTCKQSRE